MKRGDVVVTVFPGEYGKPRPGVVVQTTATLMTHPTLVLCPLTTDLQEYPDIRVPLNPSDDNGLRRPSQIMVDKVQPVRRERVRTHLGALDAATMRALDTALRVWLGLA